MANIEDYELAQVDVARQTSKNKTVPMIILFLKKIERQKFYD